MRLALASGLLGLVVAAAPATAAAPPPARLQVVAQEYSFSLSRLKLRAGSAIVELVNFGEDPHDLRLRRRGGTVTRTIRVLQAGEDARLGAKLLPGTYDLWCSLADHRARGMHARLVVVKR